MRAVTLIRAFKQDPESLLLQELVWNRYVTHTCWTEKVAVSHWTACVKLSSFPRFSLPHYHQIINLLIKDQGSSRYIDLAWCKSATLLTISTPIPSIVFKSETVSEKELLLQQNSTNTEASRMEKATLVLKAYSKIPITQYSKIPLFETSIESIL